MNYTKLATDEMQRLDPETFRNSPKFPVAIVLDNIRSAANIGAVFRICDAFNIQEICLVGCSATPPHKEIQKTALGSTETVQWSYHHAPADCIQYLKRQNLSLCCVEQVTNSVLLNDYIHWTDSFQNLALIFGNEVFGVSQEFLESAEEAIEIPQLGTKHSLNVATCVGILCWEAAKKHMLRMP